MCEASIRISWRDSFPCCAEEVLNSEIMTHDARGGRREKHTYQCRGLLRAFSSGSSPIRGLVE